MCSRSSASCEPMVPRSAWRSVDTRAYSAALTAAPAPIVPLRQPNPVGGGVEQELIAGGQRRHPRILVRCPGRTGGGERVRRRTPARRRPGDQPGQAATGEPGRGQTPRQPGVLKRVRAQCFVVDLRRLDRRPERPGAHRPRTRSMVRRCNRTPNRSATCSAIWAPDPASARMKSTISGRSLTGPRRPRRSSTSPAIPD